MEFGKDDCLYGLESILLTLELLSKTALASWNSTAQAWLHPEPVAENEFKAYDLAGTLGSCFQENNLRRVMRWVEFNTESGPARRLRLHRVLTTIQQKLQFIQSGNPQDPFLWARKSKDVAARNISSELKQASEHVRELISVIQKNSADEMTRALTLKEASKWICNGSVPGNPSDAIKKRIDAGSMRKPIGTGRHKRYFIADFPEQYRDNVR